MEALLAEMRIIKQRRELLEQAPAAKADKDREIWGAWLRRYWARLRKEPREASSPELAAAAAAASAAAQRGACPHAVPPPPPSPPLVLSGRAASLAPY